MALSCFHPTLTSEKKMNPNRRVFMAAAAAVLGTPALAQQFPNKPVRIIVPYAPGGTADVLVRAISKQMALSSTWTTVVENRPGASGIIGAEALARSPADGYTIGILATPHAAIPFTKQLQFDPRELTPVALLAQVPGILSVNPGLGVSSLGELVALARAKPGRLSYSNAGSLSAGHLAMEMFKSLAKIDITPIAYKGGAPALNDLLGGQVDMGINGAFVLPHITSGKLRPVATTSIKRMSIIPTVPTFAESGFPGFEFSEWYGAFAPANTPPELVSALNQALVKAMTSPEAATAFTSLGAETHANTSEQFKTFFNGEYTKLGRLVVSMGIKGD